MSNSNRTGTIPAHDWVNYTEAMEATIKRLRGVVIENKDATEVMLAHDGVETLHYVDPPYVFSTRDAGMDYRHELKDEDHCRLADVLNNLTGMVVLSGYRCPLYDSLYQGWRRVERRALADGARERLECLWLRNVSFENDLFETQEVS